MKLRESNVFSRVYLSVFLFTVIITHAPLDPSRHGTSRYRDPRDPASLWMWTLTVQGPLNSAEVQWLLKHVWSAQEGGKHPT